MTIEGRQSHDVIVPGLRQPETSLDDTQDLAVVVRETAILSDTCFAQHFGHGVNGTGTSLHSIRLWSVAFLCPFCRCGPGAVQQH